MPEQSHRWGRGSLGGTVFQQGRREGSVWYTLSQTIELASNDLGPVRVVCIPVPSVQAGVPTIHILLPPAIHGLGNDTGRRLSLRRLVRAQIETSCKTLPPTELPYGVYTSNPPTPVDLSWSALTPYGQPPRLAVGQCDVTRHPFAMPWSGAGDARDGPSAAAACCRSADH